MLDVVDQGRQHPFVNRGDPPFHLLGIEAVVVPADRYDRNVDVRKNVRGRAQNDQRCGNQNEQRQHHESIWPVQCKANNPHDEPLPLIDESPDAAAEPLRNATDHICWLVFVAKFAGHKSRAARSWAPGRFGQPQGKRRVRRNGTRKIVKSGLVELLLQSNRDRGTRDWRPHRCIPSEASVETGSPGDPGCSRGGR